MSNSVSLFIYRFAEKKSLAPEGILDSGELEAFSKMSSEKRRAEFLHGRLLIKSVLKSLYSVNKVSIKKSASGKPFVRGFKINLSHSKNYLVLAVAKTTELGVDIEQSQDKKHFLRVADQYFSASENQYITSAKNSSLQQKRFKNLWSLKEAYIKASGGIISKKSLQIHFDLNKSKVEKSPTSKKILFYLNTKLNLSVCVIGNASLKTFELKFNKDQNIQLKESKLNFITIK